MKTFKEINEAGVEPDPRDELLNIKLQLGEWWKKHGKMYKDIKMIKKIEKGINGGLQSIDDVVDMIYELPANFTMKK